MKLSDFEYDLPKELIAQEALPNRSDARLLVLDRRDGKIAHRTFNDVKNFLKVGDVLVLNDTKVLPARIFAKRKTGGAVEVLVLEQNNAAFTRALLKPSRRVKKGEELILDEKLKITAKVLDSADGETGIRKIQFQTNESVETVLERIGRVPLPPYIDREDMPIDRDLYQTVFAKNPGAVASPTAGLHFDKPLLNEIGKNGIEIRYVTLHVGYGTFQPVQAEDLKKHKMHEEYFEISNETFSAIRKAKSEGHRIIACGTTAVRTLEAAVDFGTDNADAIKGNTNLFIYPPFEFKVVDAMITNFHLPRTTLLMLVSAFAGHEFLMSAYQEAIANRYRFFSYGDAMLIF